MKNIIAEERGITGNVHSDIIKERTVAHGSLQYANSAENET